MRVYFKPLILLGVLCLSEVWCETANRRQALSFVVERGCMYLAHYVRKNYYSEVPDSAPTTPDPTLTTPVTVATHINWVKYLYDTLRADYVPQDLFKGLIDCGKEYSMYAIDAPEWLRQRLSVDYHAVPGIDAAAGQDEHILKMLEDLAFLHEAKIGEFKEKAVSC